MKTLKANQGFTLLEVLIALGILTIGVVAVMQIFPASLLQARIASERTITAELANSKLGHIRANSAAALFYNQVPDKLVRLSDIYNEYIYDGYDSSVDLVNAGQFLQRVTFTVELADGRQETFVTYVARQ